MSIYKIKIANVKDFLELEKQIRFFSGCEGSFCAFLQSADYAQMRFFIQSHLRNMILSDIHRVVPIPKTEWLLILQEDNRTIHIESRKGVQLGDNTEFECDFLRKRKFSE